MHVSAGKIKVSYKGIGYFFCSAECRKKFMENPAAYVK